MQIFDLLDKGIKFLQVLHLLAIELPSCLNVVILGHVLHFATVEWPREELRRGRFVVFKEGSLFQVLNTLLDGDCFLVWVNLV